ncbi:MAG TPA: hypothetical protein VHE33_06960 [Acidobacteriaceae bacterium]|nr:hypothetical protein [Acidobacteriaceae bacterium]
MKPALKVVFILLAYTCTLSVRAQCGFFSKPITGFNWYRAEGWPTPGVDDAKSIVPLTINRKGMPLIIDGRDVNWPEGITVSRLTHEKDYHLVFPSVIFQEDGQRKQMQPAGFSLVALLRWEVHGKPYALTYSVLSDTVACGFSMDLIDDVGDGKFRQMQSSNRMTIGFPPLPVWANRPTS